jgi:hypothetical protein
MNLLMLTTRLQKRVKTCNLEKKLFLLTQKSFSLI